MKTSDGKIVSNIDQFLDRCVTDAIDEIFTPKDKDFHRSFLSKPVSLVEFTISPHFLDVSDVFPNILKILALIDQPFIREVYLELGKGSGKSTIVEICSLYGIYKWLCYRDPYEYFKLLRTAKVACVNVSVSQAQARDVIFEGCLRLAERSPFFKGRFEPFKEHMVFEGGITLYAGHGNAAAWLGYSTFVGGMDECEFMVDSNNKSQFSLLYNALRGSLKTRFPRDYKLIAISSPNQRFSPLMKKCQAVLNSGKEVSLSGL